MLCWDAKARPTKIFNVISPSSSGTVFDQSAIGVAKSSFLVALSLDIRVTCHPITFGSSLSKAKKYGNPSALQAEKVLTFGLYR